MYLQTMSDIILGSSLTFSAQGGWGKEKYLAAAKNHVRPSKGMAEGGCGGNSAIPLQKIEASPAALLVESRTQQKSFLFLLEEKIRRAQIRKSEESFFCWVGGGRERRRAGFIRRVFPENVFGFRSGWGAK